MEPQVFHRALMLSFVGGLSTAIGTVPLLRLADFPFCLQPWVGVVRCGSLEFEL
jgi:hypothetical protein